MVEHSLGKGEAVSSILTSSTTQNRRIRQVSLASIGPNVQIRPIQTANDHENPCQIRAIAIGCVLLMFSLPPIHYARSRAFFSAMPSHTATSAP